MRRLVNHLVRAGPQDRRLAALLGGLAGFYFVLSVSLILRGIYLAAPVALLMLCVVVAALRRGKEV